VAAVASPSPSRGWLNWQRRMRRGFNSTLSRFLDGATSGFPPFPTNKQIEVPVSDRGTVFHGPDPTAWIEPMRRVISSSSEGEAADVGQPGRLQVAPRLGVPRRRGRRRGPARRRRRRHQQLLSRRPQHAASRRGPVLPSGALLGGASSATGAGAMGFMPVGSGNPSATPLPLRQSCRRRRFRP
jgi:hypothetical protein